jgi:hypothetical protein
MKHKVDKLSDQDNWMTYIGKKVSKHSNKPFKSGDRLGVPLSLRINEHSGKVAFEMNDGSVVDCHQVKLATN